MAKQPKVTDARSDGENLITLVVAAGVAYASRRTGLTPTEIFATVGAAGGTAAALMSLVRRVHTR